MIMSEEWQAKKQFEVRSIVEDAITSLMMAGMSRDKVLGFLMRQMAIRMNNNADVREAIKSIEDGLIDEDE